jgi:hypothetical protein
MLGFWSNYVNNDMIMLVNDLDKFDIFSHNSVPPPPSPELSWLRQFDSHIAKNCAETRNPNTQILLYVNLTIYLVKL